MSIRLQHFEAAAKYREDEARLRELAEESKKEWRKRQEQSKPVIGREEIAYIVSKMTGIPLFKLEEEETQKLLHMEEELHKRIIGQDEAISVISKAIRRSRAGLKGAKRPIGSFIFLGPTGVGKTELAKTLAEYLFGNDEALIRVDMSEYMERFSSSRLMGAPPGYVGYDEGGQLTEKVRRRPYSVVLFDEIEKAHPDLFNILLQVLEDGCLTDNFGRKVDFRNTVLIMTSNTGARIIDKGIPMGFQKPDEAERFKEIKSAVQGEMKHLFNPEFLNRVDEIVTFHPLNLEHLVKIVDLLIDELNKRLLERNFRLDVTPEAKEWLIQEGYQASFGARPLRRAIQRHVEDPLSEELIKGRFKDARKIRVLLKDTALAFVEEEILAEV
jgi:ATP-dependent Clp protease ATP-binding subunit ClpC